MTLICALIFISCTQIICLDFEFKYEIEFHLILKILIGTKIIAYAHKM